MNEPLAEATLTDVINATIRLSAATERLERSGIGHPANGNSSTRIVISAGGIGIWVCAMCCILMLVIGLMLSMFAAHKFIDQTADIRELRRESQTLKDYLAAIYAQAPHLKPKESEE